MDTLGKIKSDLKEALKAKDSFKAATLRYLISAIHNAEIAKGRDAVLTEEELSEVLQKQAKQRIESIEAYQKGDRPDLAEKEQKEREIIEVYLPDQMSEKEIRNLAQETIKDLSLRSGTLSPRELGDKEVGAARPQEMGKVMGVLMPKLKGRADGGLVSRVVRGLLNGG